MRADAAVRLVMGSVSAWPPMRITLGLEKMGATSGAIGHKPPIALQNPGDAPSPSRVV